MSQSKAIYSGFLAYVYNYVLKHGPIPTDGTSLPTMVPTSGMPGVTVSPVRTPITANSLNAIHESKQAEAQHMPAQTTNLDTHVQSHFQDLNG